MVARVKSLARGEFYYGWVIVAIGFTIQLMFAGIQGWSLGLFVKPMNEELGWSRTVISSVQTFSTFINGVFAPFVGPIIDKRGGRALMIVGTILVGAGFAALGLINSIWDFYFIRGIIVSIGITCAGALTVNVAISNWFIRKRGKAVAIGAMGTSLGGVVVVPFASYFIESYGWRTAWVLLGIAVWAVIILPVALFMKRRPEDIGLLPDGDTPLSAELAQAARLGAGKNLPTEEIWTRSEAMRTPALWLTIVAFGFSSMILQAMLVHFPSYVTDIGLTTTAAAFAVGVEALAAGVCKPLWGVLIDRYHVRHVGVAAFVIGTLGIGAVGLLFLSPAPWLVYTAAALYGFGMGGSIPVQEVLWANYYGRMSLGAIRSLGMPTAIIFSAGGPLFAGFAYDLFNGYQVAFAFFTFAYALAAVLIFLARPPKKALNEESRPVYITPS